MFMQCSDGERANTRCSTRQVWGVCGLVCTLRPGRSTGTPLRVEIERLWRPARSVGYVSRDHRLGADGIFGADGGSRSPGFNWPVHVLLAFLFHHKMEFASQTVRDSSDVNGF